MIYYDVLRCNYYICTQTLPTLLAPHWASDPGPVYDEGPREQDIMKSHVLASETLQNFEAPGSNPEDPQQRLFIPLRPGSQRLQRSLFTLNFTKAT